MSGTTLSLSPFDITSWDQIKLFDTGKKNDAAYSQAIQAVQDAQDVPPGCPAILPYNPLNEEIYKCKRMETKEILALLMKHTNLLDKKTVSSFGKWLKSSKVDLLDSPDKRVFTCDNKKYIRLSSKANGPMSGRGKRCSSRPQILQLGIPPDHSPKPFKKKLEYLIFKIPS
ncbi:hypothetical protein PHYBLDRAFT_144346 [Phycomyces blakesleeanus NRRL 1555(-)]|uniref:Uncharacterized protein n=1 Tax=Phycomyces blakesleeanus (strain ATCC 8743b / DSM 1359 / FGSC 10004 / NBRC 33097 / NRRL 1555) TaxID=763407 RepID=A0A162UGD3_PHYB8|nr:hypothetical protein PHYBLDRAFT_144346 [Phycomyces blakesleeanus NRRL 1555(-)]OAD74993.1 hypothetical protein PHYBLDRAFT_144346 [Phycomyces blakesleeanus NRRL 1555(-)]|eukprot:XP_018293033.1 hypothetical protein PHYBLDRAFT_144346 [Phycomyces blakesleeanus NRRL 1555(-)]